VTLSLLGIGTELPPCERPNAAWPTEVVEAWVTATRFSPERARQSADVDIEAEGASAVAEAMLAHRSDPFQGAVSRHVATDGLGAVDLAAAAAEKALLDADAPRNTIDFVLGSSLVPDLLNASDACGVHAKLGLRKDCLVVAADAACNSFHSQLALAEGLLATGRFRRGLLVQAVVASRVTPMDAPFSVHFGDGASAVVVGEGERRALIAHAFEAATDLYRAMVSTVADKEWWEEGRIWATFPDRKAARRMMTDTPAAARRLLLPLLTRNGYAVDEVDFFACHQATIWFRRVIQEHVGFSRAEALDTYPEAGTISAANIPLILDRARNCDLLKPGMLVATFQGGTGATYGASLVRW
jgi:3-oxoacyl-[acyl-carrier-protein] synthase-3